MKLLKKLKKKIQSRIKEELELRNIEHKSYMQERKELARQSGKQKAKKKKKGYLNSVNEKFFG